MTAAARTKAERCFALARSTKFDGERANAIAQGTRIAEGAGLSLDLFDIPGRARKAAPKPEQPQDFQWWTDEPPRHWNARASRPSRPFNAYEKAAADDAFRASWAHMAEALKRQADALLRQQRAREEAARVNPAMEAMRYLRAQGAIIESAFRPPLRWRMTVGKATLPPMSDDDLIQIAREVRAATEARDEKRAYEAGLKPCARCGGVELHAEGCRRDRS